MVRDSGSYVVLALLLTFLCDGGSSECAQSTACTCVLGNGQRYDLTNLTYSGTVTATGAESNLTFYFQPCSNARLPMGNSTGECGTGDGVSLCASDVDGKTFALGTLDETKMEFPPKYSNPVLILRHGNVTTLIILICEARAKTQLVLNSVVKSDTEYKLLLMSPHACKIDPHEKGLSTGSILVILFFVFSGLYFVGGVVALKFLRGATGWEMLPNHEFWCELPSLVRDGVIFTFNCFRADSYERI